MKKLANMYILYMTNEEIDKVVDKMFNLFVNSLTNNKMKDLYRLAQAAHLDKKYLSIIRKHITK